MKKLIAIGITIIGLSLAAKAVEGALASVGLTTADVEKTVCNMTRYPASLWLPSLGSAAPKLKALNEQARVKFVREAGAAVKMILLSPEFKKAHDEYIREQLRAVDRGYKVADTPIRPADPKQAAAEYQRKAAALWAKQLRLQPVDALKRSFTADSKNWVALAARPATSPNRDRYVKLANGAKQIESLQDSNPEEFKKAYTLLKCIERDGPDTEEALLAVPSGAEEQEQRNYNQFNLKTVLKQNLQAWLTLAESVDFSAETVRSGSLRRFANPKYERKPNTWKVLYRAGKAPTTAAVEVVRDILAAL